VTWHQAQTNVTVQLVLLLLVVQQLVASSAVMVIKTNANDAVGGVKGG
jgi:hypothetical protein